MTTTEATMGNILRSGIHWEKGPTENNDNGGWVEKIKEKFQGVGINWNHQQHSELEKEADFKNPEKLFEQKIPNVGEMISNAKSCENLLRQKFDELEEECRRKDELIRELERKVEEESATIIDLENEQRWQKCLKSSGSPKTIPSKTNCHLCNFEADNRGMLLEHVEDFHCSQNGKKVRFEGTRCPICGLSFGDDGKVERHMQRVHNFQSLEEKSETAAGKKQFSGLIKCNYCSFEIQVHIVILNNQTKYKNNLLLSTLDKKHTGEPTVRELGRAVQECAEAEEAR